MWSKRRKSDLSDFSAYILAAGAGTRLYPFSKQIVKPLLPILNKSILFHSIERLNQAGIKNLGIVIRENDEEIVKFVKSEYPDHNIDYIAQKDPLGTGHAVLQIRPHLKTPHMLIIAGDSIFPVEFINEICQVHQNEKNSITLALEPMLFEKMQYSSTVDYHSGRIWQIREKPKTKEEILSNLNSAALYVFTDT
ncbi:MAG: nucleotidyltransferase family protein, partial [Candidatus Hodarchaeales archaeon]